MYIHPPPPTPPLQHTRGCIFSRPAPGRVTQNTWASSQASRPTNQRGDGAGASQRCAPPPPPPMLATPYLRYLLLRRPPPCPKRAYQTGRTTHAERHGPCVPWQGILPPPNTNSGNRANSSREFTSQGVAYKNVFLDQCRCSSLGYPHYSSCVKI